MSSVWFFKFQVGLFNPVFDADTVAHWVFASISVIDAMFAIHIDEIWSVVVELLFRKFVYRDPDVLLYCHFISINVIML